MSNEPIYHDVLMVVKNAQEDQEVELDLSSHRRAAHHALIGQAVEEMLLASGDGEVTITVSLFSK